MVARWRCKIFIGGEERSNKLPSNFCSKTESFTEEIKDNSAQVITTRLVSRYQTGCPTRTKNVTPQKVARQPAALRELTLN